jgi:hypothetical protein
MNFETIDLLWFIPLLVWDFAWKGIALWKSAKNHQMKWFIALLVLNTVGILPIVYLKFFQIKSEND